MGCCPKWRRLSRWRQMRKTATLKDVLYALEFGQQVLTRISGPSPSWTLQPIGTAVPAQIADKAREHPSVMTMPSTRPGESRYAWQRMAA